MIEWTEGVCADGAAILKDGQPVSISGLLDHLNAIEDAKHQINNWAQAYPRDMFIPPTSEQCKEAHAALVAIGMSLDKFSGHAMRHVAEGMAKILNEIP